MTTLSILLFYHLSQLHYTPASSKRSQIKKLLYMPCKEQNVVIVPCASWILCDIHKYWCLHQKLSKNWNLQFWVFILGQHWQMTSNQYLFVKLLHYHYCKKIISIGTYYHEKLNTTQLQSPMHKALLWQSIYSSFFLYTLA